MKHLAILELSAACSAVAWLWHCVPRFKALSAPQGKYGCISLAEATLSFYPHLTA